MKVFAISDLHLDFAAQKPMDVFNDKWKNHSAQIEMNWRSEIRDEDMILIPGDISWAMRFEQAKMDLDWLERLPGTKICIRGNHDYWWSRPQKLNAYYKHILFLQNTAYFIGDLAICGTRGWNSPNNISFTQEDERLYERELHRLQLSLNNAKDAKEIWIMLHYPPTAMKEKESSLIQLLRAYPVTKVIYGHLHDELSWSQSLIGEYNKITYELVAADYLGFKPLYIGEI